MSTTEPTPRTRTFAWSDPAAYLPALRTLTGLEFLQAIQRGELPPPPFAQLIDARIAVAEQGRVVFSFTPAEYHYNPIGVVHGGMAATILDSCMSCCIQTLLPAGVAYTTVELKVNFVRPLLLTTGEVRAEGRVIHQGRTVATAEGRVTDAAGKLYAHGTTTCMIVHP